MKQLLLSLLLTLSYLGQAQINCTLDSPIVGVGGTNILCSEELGEINVTVSGGTAPYTYSIDGGATVQTSTVFNVPAGTYSITTLDANQTQSSCMITITDPSNLEIIMAVSDDFCQQGEGDVAILVEGGVGPYVVTWESTTGGQLDQNVLLIEEENKWVSFTGADGGNTFEFTIVDANGCITNLARPAMIEGSTTGYPLSLSAEIDNIESNEDEGGIDITVEGGSPPYTYTWSGAGHWSLYEDLDGLEEGEYLVTVTDENGCSTTSEFILDAPADFVYTIYENDKDCIPGGGLLELNCMGGEGPYLITYSGGTFDQDELIIDGNQGSATFTGIQAGQIYLITITAANGYVHTFEFESLNSHIPELASPELCLVTNDFASGRNVILWESPADSEQVIEYNIYREGQAAADYILVGRVASSEENYFEDLEIDPTLQAYKYQVTASDGCLAESKASEIHKTIHLTINQGVNDRINLAWDAYEGISYDQVEIYRGTLPENVELYVTLPSTTFTYTDPSPPSGNVYYQTVIPLNIDCEIGKRSYSVKSNVVNLGKTAVEETINSAVRIYPNPTSDNIYVELTEDMNIDITDLAGQQLFFSKMSVGVNVIELSEYTPGLYFMHVTNKEKIITHKITIN